jgi:hypothetical protein
MERFQRGTLRKEKRAKGEVWVLRYYVNRPTDNKRVEHTVPIGSVRSFPSESSAWSEVNRQHLHEQINRADCKGRGSHLATSPSTTSTANWATRPILRIRRLTPRLQTSK